jgi:hypothetical protein
MKLVVIVLSFISGSSLAPITSWRLLASKMNLFYLFNQEELMSYASQKNTGIKK